MIITIDNGAHISLNGLGRYRLALYSPFFVIVYKQFIDFATLVSALRAFRKSKKEWHKIDRTGGMQAINVTTRNR